MGNFSNHGAGKHDRDCYSLLLTATNNWMPHGSPNNAQEQYLPPKKIARSKEQNLTFYPETCQHYNTYLCKIAQNGHV